MKFCFLVIILVPFLNWTNSSLSSLSFNKYELFLETMTDMVYHMEPDKYKKSCNSILVSMGGQLKTVDAHRATTLLTLLDIPGFTQINLTHIAVVDYIHHCIKLFNRANKDLRDFAGTCGSFGYNDGVIGEGKMHNPNSVVLDVRNPGHLLVADQYNLAIRSVDLTSGELSTVASGYYYPFPMCMQWLGEQLFVTFNRHVVRALTWADNGTLTNTLVAGVMWETDAIGNLSVAAFAFPKEMVELHGKLLIADFSNYKLKVLDQSKQEVGPVCFRGESPCTESSEFTEHPASLLNIDDVIYVGLRKNIYKLSGNNLPCPYHNISAELPLYSQTVQVKLAEGTLVDFSEGIHKVNKAHGATMCSFNVFVFRRDSVCPTEAITAFIPHGQTKADVTLVGGETVKVPKGNFTMRWEHHPDSNFSCEYNVIVKDAPRADLLFRAVYDVQCQFINRNSIAFALLYATFLYRRDQLQRIICADKCVLADDMEPNYFCALDTLVVQWSAKQASLQYTDDLIDELREKLLSAKELRVFEIYIHDKPFSPIVAAKKNLNGQAVHVGLVPDCSDGAVMVHAEGGCMSYKTQNIIYG